MGEMRMAKFRVKMSEINSKVCDTTNRKNPDEYEYSLMLIFSLDSLNEYGKAIMLEANLDHRIIVDPFYYFNANDYKERMSSPEQVITLTKDWVEALSKPHNFFGFKSTSNANSTTSSRAYQFIFWALMILTVDKTNAEEHLSLICDFARMLHITDDELEDIVYVIKKIFYMAPEKYNFKSENVPSIFSAVLEMYK